MLFITCFSWWKWWICDSLYFFSAHIWRLYSNICTFITIFIYSTYIAFKLWIFNVWEKSNYEIFRKNLFLTLRRPIFEKANNKILSAVALYNAQSINQYNIFEYFSFIICKIYIFKQYLGFNSNVYINRWFRLVYTVRQSRHTWTYCSLVLPDGGSVYFELKYSSYWPSTFLRTLRATCYLFLILHRVTWTAKFIYI